MSHSLNEIEALSKRAARGAGMSWGMAEETGKAVRWLASHQLPGVALLAGVLSRNDGIASAQVAPTALDGVWHAPSGTLCPLAAGAALNDCAEHLIDGCIIEMDCVSHPLLIVPFAAWAALHIEAPVTVAWQNIRITTDGYGVWTHDPKGQCGDATETPMSFAKATARDDPAQSPALRGTICTGCWEQLNVFAHRTYAPATKASRLLGAGAGVSDND